MKRKSREGEEESGQGERTSSAPNDNNSGVDNNTKKSGEELVIVEKGFIGDYDHDKNKKGGDERNKKLKQKKKFILTAKSKLFKGIMDIRGRDCPIENIPKVLERVHARVSSFIDKCVTFSKSLSNVWKGLKKNDQDSVDLVEKLDKGVYFLDNIDKNFCRDVLNVKKILEMHMCINGKKIKTLFNLTSKEKQKIKETTGQESEFCIGYFEVMWLTLAQCKFFFFWYFYVYQRVLVTLVTKTKKGLSNLKESNSSRREGSENKKMQHFCIRLINIIENKLESIGDIEGEGKGEERHWFDQEVVDEIRTMIGTKKSDEYWNSLFLQKEENILSMGWNDFCQYVEKISVSFMDMKFKIEIEDIINAMELKSSMYVILKTDFLCNRTIAIKKEEIGYYSHKNSGVLSTKRNESEDCSQIYSDVLHTKRDTLKKRISPARIKQFANFFQKCKIVFYNMKALKMIGDKQTLKPIFLDLPIKERVKNKQLNVNKKFAEYIRLLNLEKIIGSTTLVESKLLYIISFNIETHVSKTMEGVIVTAMKTVPDRTLKNLVTTDQEVKCFYTTKLVQERNGIFNTIKEKLKSEAELFNGTGNPNIKNDKKNNDNGISGGNISGDYERKIESIKKESLSDNIKIEKYDFNYGDFNCNRFLNIIQTMNERERYLFHKLIFKANVTDNIFEMPFSRYKNLIREFSIIELFFAKINTHLIVKKGTPNAYENFFVNLSNPIPIDNHYEHFQSTSHPIVVKRMARYDVLYYKIILKSSTRGVNGKTDHLLVDKTSEKVLYKTGDLILSLAFWVYLCLKYVREKKDSVDTTGVDDDMILDTETLRKLFLKPNDKFKMLFGITKK